MTLSDLDPDQVPYNDGVDEQHPVACQFCEKAFASTSYLWIHEQVYELCLVTFLVCIASCLSRAVQSKALENNFGKSRFHRPGSRQVILHKNG